MARVRITPERAATGVAAGAGGRSEWSLRRTTSSPPPRSDFACGYDPVLIDPRGSFGAAHRFPGERVLDIAQRRRLLPSAQ